MSKVIICYHKDDMDGNCSAAIAYKYALESIVEGNREDIIIVPMSYGTPFDFTQIDLENDLAIFVDFTLQPFKEMLKFISTNLILIDHHKTTIESLAANPDFVPNGIIGDIDNTQSAAELAWKFFYPNTTLPLFAQYISWYDVWKVDLPNWEDHIVAFNEGIKTFLGNFENDRESWLALIDWSLQTEGEKALAYVSFMTECLRWGKQILRSNTERNNEIIKNNSFVTELEGHKALAINANEELRNFIITSPIWREGDFDIAICYNFKQSYYKVSLRTDKKDIDCSEIAKKHKGAGHAGASGFQCKKLPFKLGK